MSDVLVMVGRTFPQVAGEGELFFKLPECKLYCFALDRWHASNYSLPMADQHELGGVKVGAGLGITPHGAIYVKAEHLSDLQNDVGYITADGAQSLTNIKSWARLPYDIVFSTNGRLTNKNVYRQRACRAFVLAADQAGAQVFANTPATQRTTLIVTKNGARIGTIVFEPTAHVGLLSVTATSFAVGDVFAVMASAKVDETLADLDISILATLS